MYDLHNLQTNVLGHRNLTLAKDIIEKIFWFGITEYFDASMCLLAYQLGQFNTALCDCNLKPKVVVGAKNVSIILFTKFFNLIFFRSILPTMILELLHHTKFQN